MTEAAGILASHICTDDQPEWPDNEHHWVLCACGKSFTSKEDLGEHQAEMLSDAGFQLIRRTPCGGCRGLGAHSPRCITQPGSLWRRLMDQAEDLGDAVGGNDPEAANAAYSLAGRFREKYDAARAASTSDVSQTP